MKVGRLVNPVLELRTERVRGCKFTDRLTQQTWKFYIDLRPVKKDERDDRGTRFSHKEGTDTMTFLEVHHRDVGGSGGS